MQEATLRSFRRLWGRTMTTAEVIDGIGVLALRAAG
jgi:hypothetical protein